MNTQREQVERYLQVHGSITDGEARSHLSMTRLAARICELRASGMQINDEWVEGTNQFGKPTRYKKYILQRKPVQGVIFA